MAQDKLVVVPAQDHHLVRVAQNLRVEDRWDVRMGGIRDNLKAFREANLKGRTWAALDEREQAVAVGGVVPNEVTSEVSIWLMGTDALREHWREFARRSPQYIDALSEIYPVMSNLVQADQKVRIKWLKRVGFKINPMPIFIGPERAVFFKFKKERR